MDGDNGLRTDFGVVLCSAGHAAFVQLIAQDDVVGARLGAGAGVRFEILRAGMTA